jgi:hypothetical protein
MGYKVPSKAKVVLAIDGVLHNVRCKVYTIIDKKPCLLIPKWDILMKHEGKRKTNFFLLKLNVKKNEWYNIKSYKHK